MYVHVFVKIFDFKEGEWLNHRLQVVDAKINQSIQKALYKTLHVSLLTEIMWPDSCCNRNVHNLFASPPLKVVHMSCTYTLDQFSAGLSWLKDIQAWLNPKNFSTMNLLAKFANTNRVYLGALTSLTLKTDKERL